MWIIQTEEGKYDPVGLLYWNNDDGWVSRESATTFTDSEKRRFDCPIQGKWIKIPDSV